MFWADKTVDDIEKRYKERISSKDELIVRDEKTISGRMLMSAMRGGVVHGLIAQILSERGIKNKFLWEINDMDAFDAIPKGIDESFEKYIGLPLYKVPSPDDKEKNYPEFFAKEFTDIMEKIGFTPEYYRASDAYKNGEYNEVIPIAIENAEKIRSIYKKISNSDKPTDWLPIMMICEKCEKVSTTKAISYDDEYVTYRCECGYEGKQSPLNGNAKLPWKVEWAAKFKIYDVSIEGEGKDLSTKGGARDVANHISREVFDHIPPYDIPYEFFLSDGKKMSTSKGNAPSAKEIIDLLPPHIFRLIYMYRSIKQAIEFNIHGDTVPILFDTHDRLAEKYFEDENDDNARLFKIIHLPGEELKQHFLPRFSQVAFMVQMPHLNLVEEFEKIKGSALTKNEKEELSTREKYSKLWLSKYASENYKFELQLDNVPDVSFSNEQKEALKRVLEYIESNKVLDGQETHTALHSIRKEFDIDPKEYFGAIYQIFLGKDSGPKVGWFISVLDRDFIIKRLNEVI